MTPRTTLVVLVLFGSDPAQLPLLCCAAHALFEQSTWHVNQQTQLALGRKRRGPEAQTCAMLGNPEKHWLANDMLRVLHLSGAWALGASLTRAVRGALVQQWFAYKNSSHMVSSQVLAIPSCMQSTA